MKNRSLLPYLFFCLFSVTMLACSEEPKNILAASTTPSAGADTSEFADGTILFFKLGSKWETLAEGDAFEDQGSCAITPVSGTSINCEISVPEEKMYYSGFRFTTGTLDPVACPIVHFNPYFYQRSSSAAYVPPGATSSIDCSGAADMDKMCFGGAATNLIEGFPKNTGYYFVTSLTEKQDYSMKSENSTKQYGGYLVNYLMTSDLIDTVGTGNAAVQTERVSNSFVPYTITCNNYWGETLYTINLKILDENTDGANGGANDEYPDWQ